MAGIVLPPVLVPPLPLLVVVEPLPVVEPESLLPPVRLPGAVRTEDEFPPCEGGVQLVSVRRIKRCLTTFASAATPSA